MMERGIRKKSHVRNTAAIVWNWSGKTLSPGALLAVLYFSSFHIYFSARLDFPSSPLSAPGSPRMSHSLIGSSSKRQSVQDAYRESRQVRRTPHDSINKLIEK